MVDFRFGSRSLVPFSSSLTDGKLASALSFGLKRLRIFIRGVVNAFGNYQTFYQRDFLSHESESNISWIGSIQAFILVIVGVVTGPIFDRGYFRVLILTGSFLTVFGMMMTSICKEYWQVMLAQGIIVGTGDGCLFLPSVAIISQYFSTRKALATGIAAAGSGMGMSSRSA